MSSPRRPPGKRLHRRGEGKRLQRPFIQANSWLSALVQGALGTRRGSRLCAGLKGLLSSGTDKSLAVRVSHDHVLRGHSFARRGGGRKYLEVGRSVSLLICGVWGRWHLK